MDGMTLPKPIPEWIESLINKDHIACYFICELSLYCLLEHPFDKPQSCVCCSCFHQASERLEELMMCSQIMMFYDIIITVDLEVCYVHANH